MSVEARLTRKPRRWVAAKEKLVMVQESYDPLFSVAEVARKHNVDVSSLVRWRRLANEGSLMSVNKEERLVPRSEVKKLQAQIKSLERMLGKKTLQVELLKDAIEIAREKKLISRQPLPGEDDIASV